MPEWKWEKEIRRKKVVGYRNLIGTAEQLEQVVEEKIEKGWHVHGQMMPIISEGKPTSMFVQNIRFYK